MKSIPPLPRVFLCHNRKPWLTDSFPSELLRVSWCNCGFGDLDRAKDEPLRLPPPCPAGQWVMLDREDAEQDKPARAHWWRQMAAAADDQDQAFLIAYDPASWDPDELRTAPWWLRRKGWTGTTHAVAHMESRKRYFREHLGDYAGAATDVYYPPGYTWDSYREWASLKIGAHVRACVETGKVPIVFVDLDRDISMQTRIIRNSDKRVHWALWQDARTVDDVRRHETAARRFLDLLGVRGGGVSQ